MGNIAESAQQYKNLRLKALQASPAAFASGYELESTFTHDVWEKRLTSPETMIFTCAAIPSHSTPETPHQAEWIGQVTLHGPKFTKDLGPPHPSLGSDPDGQEE